KSTVTSLRSPLSALWDARIFSTRCRGVYERGSRGMIGAARRAPHSLQNLAPAGVSWPHDEHGTALSRRERATTWRDSAPGTAAIARMLQFPARPGPQHSHPPPPAPPG